MRTGQEGLMSQWCTADNLPLTPGTVSSGSSRKAWWRCDKGHVWQADIYSRAKSGAGCPYCRGKLPVPGETDLASQYPDLAKEWHPTRNLPLTPEQVRPGSHRRVWWICGKGHIWQAQIKSRTEGTGCPVCTNRRLNQGGNDLATTSPELAEQWHPFKNGSLTPRDVTEGSHRKVWWRCEKGHEWQAAVTVRARKGSGCPICAGKRIVPGENDLQALFPLIAGQWHPAKNGALRPDTVSPYSNRKVWWQCKLGHEYQAAVAARTMSGSRCPYCAGRKVLPGFNDLTTLEPEVAKQWHPALNGTLTPQLVTAGSHRKVWWECDQGHVWQAVIYSRTGPRKCGCPICAGRVSTKRLKQYRSMQLIHTFSMLPANQGDV